MKRRGSDCWILIECVLLLMCLLGSNSSVCSVCLAFMFNKMTFSSGQSPQINRLLELAGLCMEVLAPFWAPERTGETLLQKSPKSWPNIQKFRQELMLLGTKQKRRVPSKIEDQPWFLS